MLQRLDLSEMKGLGETVVSVRLFRFDSLVKNQVEVSHSAECPQIVQLPLRKGSWRAEEGIAVPTADQQDVLRWFLDPAFFQATEDRGKDLEHVRWRQQ